VYVATGGDIDGLPAGLHHFRPDLFALERLGPDDPRPPLASATADPTVAGAPVVLVVSALLWRKAWRYRERGFRHVVRDAGSLLANLLLVADAHGIDARVRTAFVDTAVAGALGVAHVDEVPIAVVSLGAGGGASPSTAVAEDEGAAAPAVPRSEPVSPRPLELPFVTAVREAGDLRDREEVVAWRAAAGQTPARPPTPGLGGGRPIEDVILGRGSTRLFTDEAVPLDAARSMLRAALAPLDRFDHGPVALVDVLVSVHAVDGLAPGRYRFEADADADAGAAAGALRAIAVDEVAAVRAESTRLGANHALGGDGCFTAFLAVDLDRLFDTLGPRGYRAAHVEAGVILGRLNLAATAHGIGATGLTTFGPEVATSFGADVACLVACAVGVPAYRPRLGGRPGETTVLTGMTGLRRRLVERNTAR
jgi:SagB-type dehydrogenase family enzyme